MNEDELANLLNALEQGLPSIGLSSLVTQERISAVEGKAEKPSTQDLAELRDDWSRRGIGRTPRARADDVRIRPLTASERLAELLDLIEVATGGTYAIEMRLRDDLKAGLDAETGSWDGRVVFADPPESELSETTTREWTLPDQSVLRQREAAVREVIGPTPTAGNDLYEAYLFGLVLVAASREGFNAVLADADGPATVLRLRRAPGRLPSGGLPGARFTHAVLECPPRPALELHTGVGVVGQSKVVHEADVLVLPQADADRCRSLDLDPRGRDAELLIEAKYYTNPVGLGTGREFLGLRSDISAKHKVFVATLVGDSVLSLFSGKSVPHDICVFPVGVGRRVYLA